jgi:hypothetical protein
MTVVGVFRSVADALVARGALEQAGIESSIRSDNAGGQYPALDAASLLVRAEDADAARAVLQASSED